MWALVIGLPLNKLMIHQAWLKWWQYVIAGCISGTPFALFWVGWGSQLIIVMLVSAALVAGASAIVFWLIVKPAPNKSINNAPSAPDALTRAGY
jgi:hypothetical protein